MRKTLAAVMAAITFAGAAGAGTAQARSYNYRHHDRDDAGVAIAAGVVGLALGAALASSSRDHGYYERGYYEPYYGRHYHHGGYGRGYYGYDRGYAYGYRTCTSWQTVYDPYIGRPVQIRRAYPC